jgi:hypothetical protein
MVQQAQAMMQELQAKVQELEQQLTDKQAQLAADVRTAEIRASASVESAERVARIKAAADVEVARITSAVPPMPAAPQPAGLAEAVAALVPQEAEDYSEEPGEMPEQPQDPY